MAKTTKSFQELTIQDNFLFGAVMMDEEICRDTIELVLGIPVETVSVVKEKSMQYHSEYRGVRLDVCAKDEDNTHYDVEMQVTMKPFLTKRTRYYHDQMDMEVLESGEDYEKLPDAYVIFICCFDPFGDEQYCYTVSNYCEETGKSIWDGRKTIYLSTEGKNEDQVSPELVSFLKFVKANNCNVLSDDPFVQKIQEKIRQIKKKREMGEKYMLLELMLRDEKREGLAEGRTTMAQEYVLFFLQKLGSVSDQVKFLIKEQMDTDVLMEWADTAAHAVSVEAFVDAIQKG